jgi:DNA mismatch endonuclease (patch repair protein)
MAMLSNSTRSKIMKTIKKKNTKPELFVRKWLWAQGLRFRLHNKKLPGTPDVVFNKQRMVIFVHGCFWHQHKCKKGTTPSTNRSYWIPKLIRNQERDKKVLRELRAIGWTAIVIWECELNDKNVFNKLHLRLSKLLSQN